MKIDKHELITALKFVESTMNDSDISGSNKILTFSGTDVCAMNDELHLRYPIKTDFKTTVPTAPLVKLLDKINADEIDLALADKELKIKAGKARAAFPLEDTPEHIDEVKAPNQWHKLPDDFVQAVQLTQFTSTPRTDDPAMSCTHFDRKHVETTNGSQMTRYTIKKSLDDAAFMLRTKSAVCASKINPTHYGQTQGWAQFKNSEGIVISVRIRTGEFLPLDKVLKQERKTKIEFPETLRDALQRASVFCDDESPRVTVEIKDNKIRVHSKSNSGWIKERVSCDEKTTLVFDAYPQAFIAAMDLMSNCRINAHNIMIEGENFQHAFSIKQQAESNPVVEPEVIEKKEKKMDRPMLKELSLKPYKSDISGVGKFLGDLAFQKVKTRYTKGGDWTAISLYGYGKDPLDILKPGVLKSSPSSETTLQWTSLKNESAMKPILKILDKLPCEKERVRFMKLEIGKVIGRHTDKIDKQIGFEDGEIIRIHIPIQTDDRVVFTLYNGARDKDGTEYNLEVGHFYYTDVTKPHAVTNGSDADRIHLVVDCFANDDLRNLILK